MNLASFCVLLGHAALLSLTVEPAASGSSMDEAFSVPPAHAAIENVTSCGTKWGFHLVTVLHDDLIQGELALTRGQRDAIGALGQEFLDALGTLVREHRPRKSPDEAEAKTDSGNYQRRRAMLIDSFGVRATLLLTESQRRRLVEVLFQLRGEEIFFYADVADALALSDDQKGELAAIRLWLVGKAKELFTRFPPEQWQGKQCRECLDGIRGEAKRRALKVLSDAQRRQFEILEGPPIAFSRQELQLEIRRRQR